VLKSEGGWCAILKIPNMRSEEEWALKLLDEAGVYVFPGYFFEFQENGYLVLSLLTDQSTLAQGLEQMVKIIR
jgi:hypothetical protein